MSESIPASKPVEDRATLETRHTGLLMTAVMGVSIIQFLDATIANVALPHMQASLGASLDTIAWVLTSYIIATVLMTPAVGWISDRLGSRRVFLWAVTGFLLTSMLCGAATSMFEMVLFRVLQGFCAAFIGPMSQTIMYDINPPSKQPRAVAIWGMVVMVAPICGPMLGGLLTESLNWRWVFYVNLPIGIPTLAVLFWLLPSRPQSERRLDRFGFVMLALALVSLQLMLDRGQSKDWFSSPEILIELLLALGAFWVFFTHTLTTNNPLFPAGLLRNPGFLAGFVFMFVLGVANIAIASVQPIMFQNVYGYGPWDTGLLLMPRGIGVIITMTIVARIMDKVDARYLMVLGFGVASFALWMMSQWALEMGRGPILLAGFIQGLGLGLTFMPMNVAAFMSLEPRYRPDGSSLLNLMRSVGGSFGISLMVTYISRNTQTSHADMAGAITHTSLPGVDPQVFTDRLGVYGSALWQLADLEITRQSLMIAYLDNFYLMAILVMVVALGTLLFKPIRIRTDGQEQQL
ncbi:DHA2 family efflux MFS transporter permease subunit [Mangrovimicrobium sediminis]|uniref:DHA2 family efflux MFS transporter permease subunit n=1 Tax=Mangrovimicrobium sediminis TaxID=2562682 RepID=A0A4Z0LT72_9GAMM|nr:DHA2 family efflux MFS transporter permease subunit [Haliea sp. SAOS-164]TGD70500.1 DHA2 family efflux MFS transporter permease subunit [Haliea sp. SAOS-164]